MPHGNAKQSYTLRFTFYKQSSLIRPIRRRTITEASWRAAFLPSTNVENLSEEGQVWGIMRSLLERCLVAECLSCAVLISDTLSFEAQDLQFPAVSRRKGERQTMFVDAVGSSRSFSRRQIAITLRART